MKKANLNNKGRAFTISNPDTLSDPATYAYSHLGAVPADQKLIFVAGQGGSGAGTDDFRAQCQSAITNVDKVMKAAGGAMKDIVKFTIYIVDHTEEKHKILIDQLHKKFGELYTPTCSLIPVPRLALNKSLIEIEAIATLKE